MGGFAVVLRADDDILQSPVAVKVLMHQWATDGDIRERFIQEARLLRRISSPHVIAVHDIGQLDDGRPYFVMDYASGGSIAQRLEAGHVADTASVERIVDSLSCGLAVFHDAGVVHRDINPRNMLIGQTGTELEMSQLLGVGETVHLADLGLAKDQERTSIGATILGGTPGYASPEQMSPAAMIGPASDIYGATAMLWKLVTGTEPPQHHEVSGKATGIDVRWREFFETGLALEPDARHPTILDWGAAAAKLLRLRDDGRSVATGAASLVKPSTSVACPYKGLASFQPEDAEFFFGRSSLVDELLRRVATHRSLVVAGPSGSGKSSVVRAGLLPALDGGALPGSQGWKQVIFTPGSEPLRELAFQLNETDRSAPVSAGEMRAEPRLARRFCQLGLVVVIDQFEELFTMTADRDEIDAFLAVLRELTDPLDSRVRVILAMRADFYNVAASYPWLENIINANHVLVGPMHRTQLREAILEPARRAGLTVEDGLIDDILDQAGNEPGSLPLVSHALMETWGKRRGHLLTRDGLHTAGGVLGSIATSADHLFDDQFDDNERSAARRLMLRLVTPGDGTPDTRRPMPLGEVEDDLEPAVMKRVVDKLTAARLVTVDDKFVDIGHEALIGTWPRFGRWIDEERGHLRDRQRLSAQARTWSDDHRDPDLLLRGRQLDASLAWSDENRSSLNRTELEYLEQSEAARDAQLAATRRRRTTAFAALSLFAVAATITSVIAFVAYRQSAESEREAQTQTAMGLATQAQSLADDDPALALALAYQSEARMGPSLAGRDAIIRANLVLDQTPLRTFGDPLAVGASLSVAMNPDGTRFAIGALDGEITLFDTAARIELANVQMLNDEAVRSLVFNPSGTLLAALSQQGGVLVWDVGKAAMPQLISSTTISSPAWSLTFSGDEQLLASTEDGQLVVVDARTGQTTASADFGSDTISVAAAPSGKLAALGDGRGTLRFVDLASLELRSEVQVSSGDVWEIVFDASSEVAWTRSFDGKIARIDVATGTVSTAWNPPPAQYSGLQVDQTNSWVIAGAGDGRIRVLDPQDGSIEAESRVGHSETVKNRGAALSANGALLVTIGADNEARLWDLSRPPAAFRTVSSLDAPARAVAIDASGDTIVMGLDNGSIHIAPDEGAGSPKTLANVHDLPVLSVAINPTGTTVASGDSSGLVNLTNLSTGVASPLIGHSGAVLGAVFANDNVLLTSSEDGTVRTWDVASGSQLHIGQHVGTPSGLALHPERTTVAVASLSGLVRFWNLDGEVVGEDLQLSDAVRVVAYANDGSLFAAALDNGNVEIWDLATAEQATPRPLSVGGTPTGVVFSPDDANLVATSRNGTAQIFDTASGAPVGPRLLDEALGVVMHPGQPVFVTIDDQSSARRWFVLDNQRACRLSRASFDQSQQLRYLGAGEAAVACEES